LNDWFADCFPNGPSGHFTDAFSLPRAPFGGVHDIAQVKPQP
jgi:hypothetical protein